jgi:hypothetical protein
VLEDIEQRDAESPRDELLDEKPVLAAEVAHPRHTDHLRTGLAMELVSEAGTGLESWRHATRTNDIRFGRQRATRVNAGATAPQADVAASSSAGR